VLEFMSSFTLWAVLTTAFCAWISGYAYYVETQHRDPQRQDLRTLRWTLGFLPRAHGERQPGSTTSWSGRDGATLVAGNPSKA
jgi:hypothetical protein